MMPTLHRIDEVLHSMRPSWITPHACDADISRHVEHHDVRGAQCSAPCVPLILRWCTDLDERSTAFLEGEGSQHRIAVRQRPPQHAAFRIPCTPTDTALAVVQVDDRIALSLVRVDPRALARSRGTADQDDGNGRRSDVVGDAEAEALERVAREIRRMRWIERPTIVTDIARVAAQIDEFFAHFVAVTADRLQLAVPEFFRVAEVSFHVVDHGRDLDLAGELAHDAERFCGEL